MKRLVTKAINPLKFFIADSRAIGVLLLLCTGFSLLMSNTISGEWYRSLWNTNTFSLLNLPHSPLKWINDFLMAFFFLFAGMEIKRELVCGELSGFKKAILPFGAALGGMVVPALIFLSFNIGSGFTHGWGIPTATDIAFSFGNIAFALVFHFEFRNRGEHYWRAGRLCYACEFITQAGKNNTWCRELFHFAGLCLSQHSYINPGRYFNFAKQHNCFGSDGGPGDW